MDLAGSEMKRNNPCSLHAVHARAGGARKNCQVELLIVNAAGFVNDLIVTCVFKESDKNFGAM